MPASCNEKAYELGAQGSSIRQLFAYGQARKAQIGDDKVFDFSIGNPSVPAPAEVKQAIVEALDEPSLELHGYTPAAGLPSTRTAIADVLNARHGTSYTAADLYLTMGAAAAIDACINAVCEPGDEVVVIAPFFPEYRVWIEAAGCRCVLSPARADSQIDFDDLASRITARTRAVIINSPNNPTGTTLTHEQLKRWVDYALANDTLIVFDAAYEAYITEPDVPHSIYEIRGAKKVAIEIRSFSKTAGFTGVRCGYTVIPKEVTAADIEGRRIPLNPLWNRRQCTKFNGTSYITQRGAEAVYSPEGQAQVRATIDYYMANARLLREGLSAMGLTVYGGVNAPYIWLKAPGGATSWRLFDRLLYEAGVVTTPGVGFGPSGEGYVRLTAFGRREDCEEALHRIRTCL